MAAAVSPSRGIRDSHCRFRNRRAAAHPCGRGVAARPQEQQSRAGWPFGRI